ncbi:HAD family hydrolase [Streptomyces phyllanthi]|uniref:HAD family hydrolase n=1 Tax=Streptomyces phyllanthi TaxID=1803180 RepID=A0A5N8W2X6_9ACTN|nr:HAD family hydrolase [Streptomyces phyllanthi]MPY41847.1 HAD family hydrolase [Streptomyces phyllanthi]
MPLLMLDLDNTLVDRDTAFRDAATDFLAEHALPQNDLAWLMSLDASGYTPRQEVARALADRYGTALPDSAVRALLDHGAADRVVLADAVRDALGRAINGGWICAIVTNGRVAQQEAKIRNTGLDEIAHGWVVSEAVGHTKPAPEMFRAAATAVGASLHGAWMIGDSAHADIRGAVDIGVQSVWVSGGLPWSEAAFRPTHVADDTASAIGHVINAVRPPTAQ